MPKVMVVDDSLSVRKVVEHALKPHQLEVVGAASAAEALDRLERERPDVVICDVILPDKEGYEVCRFVRAHARLGATPVLLISGIVDDTVRERAAEVQSNGVMFKPFTADTLVRKVDELLATRAPAPRTEVSANGHVARPARPAAPISAAAAPARPVVRAATPSPAASEPAKSSMELLRQLVAIPGVGWALIVDRAGFVIESAGTAVIDADIAGALASCLVEATEGIGRELAQGAVQGMILEYESTTLLLQDIAGAAVLVVSVPDASALGKARYYVKKALPDLAREL
jgi:CheY-like chemotaxis protein/predicted regulator of Ras-like GTPase activity (Roadblock/LC7/MglB family)